jgi:neutral ceramidase
VRQAKYLAGAASVVITPEEPTWMAGLAARKAPSRGKIHDLHAKALALQDEQGGRLVIVTMDLIAITPHIASTVAGEIQRRQGLPRERILFSASHTHFGPEVRLDKAEFFGIPAEYAAKIEPYVAKLIPKLVDVIDRAIGSLAPATLTARETKSTFAINRRKQRGGVDHGVDHHVPVLDVRRPDGSMLAVVFGYACHCTVLEPNDCRFCGDWAGFAQEYVERDFPGATALFITGAAADQHADPRYKVELSEGYGRQLADAVKASLSGETPGRPITGPMRVAYEDVPLPFERIPSREELHATLHGNDEPVKTKSRYLLRQMDDGHKFPAAYPCPLQVVRFGDEMLLIAIGGEPVVDYAHMMGEEFAGPVVWVAGYCNDMFAYVPTKAVLAEGGYEGGRSVLWSYLPAPFTGETEDRVMGAARRLVSGTKT